jgi:hypothetical protein
MLSTAAQLQGTWLLARDLKSSPQPSSKLIALYLSSLLSSWILSLLHIQLSSSSRTQDDTGGRSAHSPCQYWHTPTKAPQLTASSPIFKPRISLGGRTGPCQGLSRGHRILDGRQGLLQVCPDVLHVLQPAAEADQVVLDAILRALLRALRTSRTKKAFLQPPKDIAPWYLPAGQLLTERLNASMQNGLLRSCMPPLHCSVPARAVTAGAAHTCGAHNRRW